MDYYGNYDFVYGYDYYTPSDIGMSADESILAGIFAIYMIFILVGFLLSLVDYIFRGIGLYTIAKREGKDYPWLAFVPFARTYLQGEISGTILLKKKQIRNPGIWLIVLPFIAGIVGVIFYVIFCASIFGVMISMDYRGMNFSTGGIIGLVILCTIAMLSAVVYNAGYKVFQALVNKQIYEKFTSPNMSVAHAVLGVLIPLYESICLFVMRGRNYNPGKEPDLGTPFMVSPDAAFKPISEDTVDGEFKPVSEDMVDGEFKPLTEEKSEAEVKQVAGSYEYGTMAQSDETSEESEEK